jgi:hypothetical protein
LPFTLSVTIILSPLRDFPTSAFFAEVTSETVDVSLCHSAGLLPNGLAISVALTHLADLRDLKENSYQYFLFCKIFLTFILSNPSLIFNEELLGNNKLHCANCRSEEFRGDLK